MDILDQSKQSSEVKKSEHPNVNLAATFYKPAGGANIYFRFGYVPQTNFNNTQEQVSVSINADLINANKMFNNK